MGEKKCIEGSFYILFLIFNAISNTHAITNNSLGCAELHDVRLANDW